MSGSEHNMPDGRTSEAYMEDYRRMLEKIDSGIPPNEDELEKAPLITRWVVDEVNYVSGETLRHIFGHFHGHPFILEGNYGRTSPLLQLDRAMRWARCWSRIYRLKDPLKKSRPDREV